MNPEGHLIVKFLRFWAFNDAADALVKSICGSDTQVSYHENVQEAITALTNSITSRETFFLSKKELFKEIGNKYQVNDLKPEDVLRIDSCSASNAEAGEGIRSFF